MRLPDEQGFISQKGAEIITRNLDKATAVLIGPGFGLRKSSQHFINDLLNEVKRTINTNEKQISFVIDADGLKLLSQIPKWNQLLPPLSILTPHPGEMSFLTNLSINEIQKDRIQIAKHYSKQWGHILVLKGAFTVIASPTGDAAIIPIATPALARAGTGDVLAGLITGLAAQHVAPFNAAVLGAWIHGESGLLAEEALGNSASVLAGDVLASVSDILSIYNSNSEDNSQEHHHSH